MTQTRGNRKTHGMVTAQDVADDAGVSLTTVSRSFGDAGLVSEKTREKVLSVAAQLGYSPNIAARVLASRRSRLIGLMVNNFDDPENLNLFRYVSAEAQKRNYHAILLNTSRERSDAESTETSLLYQVDGLLVAASHLGDEVVRRCTAQGKPIVILGRKSNRPEFSSVYCDNEDGAKQVADYFFAQGVDRPAFLGGSPIATVTKERQAGFVRRVEELYGIQPIVREAGANDYAKGIAMAKQMLSFPKCPDGFFCSSDLLAIAMMDALAETDLPDLKQPPLVVGFGKSMLSRLSAYQLKSVALPLETMVRTGTSYLIDTIAREDFKPERIVFPCELLPDG